MKNATITESAIKMTILDAIEKGHTNPAELIDYMQSETFKAAVQRWIELLSTI